MNKSNTQMLLRLLILMKLQIHAVPMYHIVSTVMYVLFHCSHFFFVRIPF